MLLRFSACRLRFSFSTLILQVSSCSAYDNHDLLLLELLPTLLLLLLLILLLLLLLLPPPLLQRAHMDPFRIRDTEVFAKGEGPPNPI